MAKPCILNMIDFGIWEHQGKAPLSVSFLRKLNILDLPMFVETFAMQASGTDYGSRGDNASSGGSRSVGLDEAGGSKTSQIGEIIFLNSRAEPPVRFPTDLKVGRGT